MSLFFLKLTFDEGKICMVFYRTVRDAALDGPSRGDMGNPLPGVLHDLSVDGRVSLPYPLELCTGKGRQLRITSDNLSGHAVIDCMTVDGSALVGSYSLAIDRFRYRLKIKSFGSQQRSAVIPPCY